jgi:hypothetical protein
MQLLMLLVRALPTMAQVVVVRCVPRKLRIIWTALPNQLLILTNFLLMIPWTMNMWVDLGLIPASVLPTSNLAMKLQVDQRPTPASILPTSNLTANLRVVLVCRGFGLVPWLLLEGGCPEVEY